MRFNPFRNRVSVAERAFVARQLATMLTSGLAIDRAVAILAHQTGNRYLADIFDQISKDLESGLAFSTAAAKFPRLFNRVYLNVVIAGESVGKLAEVLQEVAGRLERENEFTSRIRAALYYPIFILVAMVLIGIILMITVVPEFKSVFSEANIPLPLTTTILIAVSDFLAAQWLLTIFGFIALVYGFLYYVRSKQGKYLLDFMSLRIPTGIGVDVYMSRFARTLALLSRSGTPIIEALTITAEVINNRFYAAVLAEARDEIARGIPLSVPLSKNQIFPVIVPQMVLVGEQTGKMDDVLTNLADYYEEETSNKIKALQSLFEPAILILVGLAVAYLVFAIFIPLYSITRFL
ncbi:MAG: type II secretion system F family protein [Patescibacteria group bacterium]